VVAAANFVRNIRLKPLKLNVSALLHTYGDAPWVGRIVKQVFLGLYRQSRHKLMLRNSDCWGEAVRWQLLCFTTQIF
jgi:hypothetical protein